MSSIWIPKQIFDFIHTGVKDLSTGVKYMDSKVEVWFYSYRGGSTMSRNKIEMCRSTMSRNLYKLTKIFNDVLSKYLKNGLGDLHETL